MQENRRNYYRILQVQPDAPSELIKASYRTLMQTLRMHPDLGGDHWNATLVNEAYSVLSNTAMRQQYDAELIQQFLKVRNSKNSPDLNAHEKNIENENSIKDYCSFCKTPYCANQHRHDCHECHSPLTAINEDDITVQSREALRKTQAGSIYYCTYWGSPYALATVVDLSATGMAMLTETPINPNQIIKISHEEFSALGKVVTCEAINAASYRIGLQFTHVKFDIPQGNFVSKSV